MKYYHSLRKNRLTSHLTPLDKIIHTQDGDFKIRKNGRITIVLDRGNENEEWLKVTPIK